MRSIDDIIFDSKREVLYAENSDGSGNSSGWEYIEVVAMMREYAKEVLDEFVTEIVTNKRGIFPIETPMGETPDVVANMYALEQFKEIVIDETFK